MCPVYVSDTTTDQINQQEKLKNRLATVYTTPQQRPYQKARRDERVSLNTTIGNRRKGTRTRGTLSGTHWDNIGLQPEGDPCYQTNMTIIVLSALLSCSNTIDESTYSGTWTVPTWDILDDLELPPGPDGTGYMLLPGRGEQALWADPSIRDEVTDAAACSAILLACVSPPERNVLGCLENAPTCPAGDDFCCPASCSVAYNRARSNGLGESDAAVEAIFGEDSCIEGM